MIVCIVHLRSRSDLGQCYILWVKLAVCVLQSTIALKHDDVSYQNKPGAHCIVG